MPLSLMFKYGLILYGEAFALWMYYAIHGRGTAYARGITAALKSLPKLLEARKKVQAERVVSASELEKQLSWPRITERVF